MRRKLGERSKVSPHLSKVVFIAGVASALVVHAARGAAQEPQAQPYALQIERCEGLPFDVDAYESAVAVELQALGGEAAPAAPRQLTVRSPSCSEELKVSLREGEREAIETLHSSDFAGVGQERALALATIEALRALDAQLSAPPPASPPAPAPPPPPPAPPPPPPPTPASIEVYAGAGVGLLFDAMPYQAEAGVAFAIGSDLWIETELAYVQASDRTGLGAIDAWALTFAASIEQHLRPAGPLELSLGVGLRGGFARATAEPTEELVTEAIAAQVLLGFIELGASLELWRGLTLGLFFEPGIGIETARFSGPTADEQNAAPTLADEAVPQVQVLGPGLYSGLTLGYRF